MKVEVKKSDVVIDTIEVPDYVIERGIFGQYLTNKYGNYGWTGYNFPDYK